MFDFDEAIKLALKTWYPEGHSLYLNPHHPLGKLAGEWGELYDDYYKFLYKPGYKFEPLGSGELGDIWYYLRILCHQSKHVPQQITLPLYQDLDSLIEDTAHEVFGASKLFRKYKSYPTFCLDLSFATIARICIDCDFTITDLTEANWEKLKPGSERGNEWETARAKYGKTAGEKRERIGTDYIGGKVTKK